MERLSKILKKIDCIVWKNGEEYYSFLELIHYFRNHKDENLIAEDMILTPFYIVAGSHPMVYEIYEYELCIEIVDGVDFEKYVMEQTGRSCFDDIPKAVVALHRMCYIPVLKEKMELPVLQVLEYAERLLSKHDVISNVMKSFGTYQLENMRFSIYV